MSEYLGIYQGSVVDNNDPLNAGRVLCLIPSVLADQTSPWCLPVYPTITKPDVGDIVYIQFLNGDPAKPVFYSSEEFSADKIKAGSITAEMMAFIPATSDDLDATRAAAVADIKALWASGTDATLIDGGKIYTNSVLISSVNGLQSSLDGKETPTAAQAKADAARAAAVSDIKALWASGSDATLIDGGKIYTNSVLIGSVNGLQSSLDSKETPTGAQTKATAARTGAVADVKAMWASGADATLIDGGKIYTNSVLISSVNGLQTSLDSKETPTGAQTKATAARTGAVSDVKALWASGVDSTLIDGGKIYTNSILVSSVNGLQSSLDSKAAGSDLTAALSRGVNLVTNGNGSLGSNRNFSTLTYNTTDVPTGASGSFQSTVATTSAVTDELLPVDPNKIYELSFDQRQVSGTGYFYGMLSPYDAYGNNIPPLSYMAQPNTQTTLAAALNPGDTHITLTSSANWTNSAGSAVQLRSIIFWDYVDPGGKVWGVNTYSRNYIYNAYADGGISGNVITLSAPYSGPAKPVGTKLSNGNSGGSYMYLVGATAGVSTWTNYTGRTVKGVLAGGGSSAATTKFPMATAAVKVGFLINYSGSGSAQGFANVQLREVTAAADLQAQWASSADSTLIDGGKIWTGSIASRLLTTDVFQTSSAVGTSGNPGVKIDSTGIKAYNSTAANTVAINSDGSATINGTFKTAATGARVEIPVGGKAINLYPTSTTATPGALTTDADSNFGWIQLTPPKSSAWNSANGDTSGYINIQSATAASNGNNVVISGGNGVLVDGANLYFGNSTAQKVNIWSSTQTSLKSDSLVYLEGFGSGTRIDISRSGTGTFQVYDWPSGNPVIYANSVLTGGVETGQVYIRDPANSGTFVRCQSGVISLAGGVNGVNSTAINATSATLATSVGINSGGTLYKGSSSLKYKTDVRSLSDYLTSPENTDATVSPMPLAASLTFADQAAVIDPTIVLEPDVTPVAETRKANRTRIIDIEPIIYKDKIQVDHIAAGDTETWGPTALDFVGWSAESVAEAGWEELVTRDYETDELEGIQYDRMLIIAVHELKEEIDSLRAELDALKAPQN